MSNNLRLYLWIALAALLWINYTTWTAEFAPPAGPAAASGTPAKPSSLANRIPQSQAPQQTSAPATPSAPPPVTHAPNAHAPLIHVQTDVYQLEISTQGGTVVKVDLLKYARVTGKAARLQLENTRPATEYLLQTGLTGPDGQAYPNQGALYRAPHLTYSLGDAKELRVPLTWTHDGITVIKTFVFQRGSYRIGLEYAVENHGASSWRVSQYAQLFRNDPRTKVSYFDPSSRAYHGPAIWNGKEYVQLDPTSSEYQHYHRDVTGGWIAGPW